MRPVPDEGHFFHCTAYSCSVSAGFGTLLCLSQEQQNFTQSCWSIKPWKFSLWHPFPSLIFAHFRKREPMSAKHYWNTASVKNNAQTSISCFLAPFPQLTSFFPSKALPRPKRASPCRHCLYPNGVTAFVKQCYALTYPSGASSKKGTVQTSPGLWKPSWDLSCPAVHAQHLCC